MLRVDGAESSGSFEFAEPEFTPVQRAGPVADFELGTVSALRVGKEFLPVLGGAVRLPDRLYAILEEVADALVIRRTGKDIAIGGHRQEPVAGAAALVAEPVRH
jgi:hypothetical protein